VGTSAFPTAWHSEGVKAIMTTPGGYVLCTSDTGAGTNFSTAWVMVQGDQANTGYVQAGTIYRYGYSCPLWWSQEGTDSTHWQNYYLPGCAPQDGSTHYIQVYYVKDGNGNYHFIEKAGLSSNIHSSSLNLSIIKGNVFTP
jgi:hypothetical protein